MISSPLTSFSSPESDLGDDPRPIINLRDFVLSVSAHNPKLFNDPSSTSSMIGISSKWRCRLVPEFDSQERLILKKNYLGYQESNNQQDEKEIQQIDKKLKMLHFFANGVPALADAAKSKPVHDVCHDALEFINDPTWRHFPAPKIAFRGGWAGPGTKMEDAKLHQMVRGFDEVLDASKCATDEELATQYSVLKKDSRDIAAEKEDEEEEEEAAEKQLEEKNPKNKKPEEQKQEEKPQTHQVQQHHHTSDEILNLQLFHRPDAALHPQLPILSENLVWPDSVATPSVVCDNATRVSKAGAITWWHLDDCGEFVMQTGLDRKDGEKHLEGVKLFIYGPTSSYDWFMHDAQSEANGGGKIAALDILKTPSDALPPAEFLPILNVAVLQAGGRPLISPPNIPHLVITLRDCVMVEQRRVMLHFLHEVLYFAQRMQLWKGSPVLYPILGHDLQEDGPVMEIAVTIAKKLEKILDNLDNDTNNNSGSGGKIDFGFDEKNKIYKYSTKEVIEMKRMNSILCVRSLLSLTNSQLFKGSNNDALSDRVRQILSSLAQSMPIEISDIISIESGFLEEYCDIERNCWMHLDNDATLIFRMFENNFIQDRAEKSDRKFSCVLYYGGDLGRIHPHNNKTENDDQAKNAAANATATTTKKDHHHDHHHHAGVVVDGATTFEDEDKKGADNHPVAKKLRNGFLPCWVGGVFDSIAAARDEGRKAVTNLKSIASSEKGEPITLQQIMESFKEKDEMLDEFF